ncbi:hypothetical protein B0T19DRAFT_443294 [Cercophora scortea]|uniref:Rhodopsin domain-containing protein n=1 Tax=Cercophora scortea TaxID=314031 RepID=A0AAE0IF08_9PEZI|nr:hypothetical protein B0T19DRAFT_443294 [Cercophora scortea]
MVDNFSVEAYTLLGVGLAIIALRLYTRITTVGFGRLQADDYLMVLAAIVYSAETFLAYGVGTFWHGLANNAMTDEQRRLLDPSSDEYKMRVNGSKFQVAGWSTYTFLLWILKATMCTFFIRLTDGLDFRRRIYFGFGLIVATWLILLLTILFGCFPIQKNWQIYPNPGNFCQPAISRIDIFVTLVLNVSTDLYLMSIPLPMLWRSSLRPWKKAGLMVLFSGGIFVTMAGILRCVLIVTDPVDGAEQAGSWAVRETFVAVVTSNLPMVVPLVNRWIQPMFGHVKTFTSQVGHLSGMSRSADPMPGAFRLEDKSPRRGRRPRSVNPLTDISFDGSEDRMVHDRDGTHITDRGAISNQPDLEAGRGLGPGVILKQTSVHISETRRNSRTTFPSDDGFPDIGDYYLTEQSIRGHQDRPMAADNAKRQRAGSGISFGLTWKN